MKMQHKLSLLIALISGIFIPIIIWLSPIVINKFFPTQILTFQVSNFHDLNASSIFDLEIKNESEHAEKNVKIFIDKYHTRYGEKLNLEYDSSRDIKVKQDDKQFILEIGDLKAGEVFTAVLLVESTSMTVYDWDGEARNIKISSDERIGYQRTKSVFYEDAKTFIFWVAVILFASLIIFAITFEFLITKEIKIKYWQKQINDANSQIQKLSN